MAAAIRRAPSSLPRARSCVGGFTSGPTRRFRPVAPVISRPLLLRNTLRHLDLLFRASRPRSEEHTSELQSRPHLVCRLLLEKKKKAPLRGPHLVHPYNPTPTRQPATPPQP